MEFRLQSEGLWLAHSTQRDWQCSINQSGNRFNVVLHEISTAQVIGRETKFAFPTAVEAAEIMLGDWLLSYDEEE